MADELDAFFSGIPDTRKTGVFDRWLKEDPKRTEKFWNVLDESERRGISISAVLKRWNETESKCPVQRCQVQRRWRERQDSR